MSAPLGPELLLVSAFASPLADVLCGGAPDWRRAGAPEPPRPALRATEWSMEIAAEVGAAAAAAGADPLACAVVAPATLRACRVFGGAWVTVGVAAAAGACVGGPTGGAPQLAWLHVSDRVGEGAVCLPPHALFHITGGRGRAPPAVRLAPLPGDVRGGGGGARGGPRRSFACAPATAAEATLARIGRPEDADVDAAAFDAALREHLAGSRAVTVGVVVPVPVRGRSVLNGPDGVALAASRRGTDDAVLGAAGDAVLGAAGAGRRPAAGCGAVVEAVNAALRRDRVVYCVVTSLRGGGDGGDGDVGVHSRMGGGGGGGGGGGSAGGGGDRAFGIVDPAVTRVVRSGGSCARAATPGDDALVASVSRVLACGAAWPCVDPLAGGVPVAPAGAGVVCTYTAGVAARLVDVWGPLVSRSDAGCSRALRCALGLFGRAGSGKRAAVAAAAAALGMHVAERSFHELSGLTSRSLAKNLLAFVTGALECHTPCVIVVRSVADRRCRESPPPPPPPAGSR